MNYYLIKYRDNWADEMDIYGFTLVSSLQDKESLLDDALDAWEETEEAEYSVGTNEQIWYEDIEDVRRAYTVVEIPEDEYNTLRKHFGAYWGDTGPLDF